jgi:hypothetical protein
MAGQETTGKPVRHTETTQEAIISRGIETREGDFESVGSDLEELGADVANKLKNIGTGAKMGLHELRQLRSDMSSIADEVEGAADELRAIIQEAEAHEPPVLLCRALASKPACVENAKYMAPLKKVGDVQWVPVCEKHARGWWKHTDEVGKMYEIGKGIVEPPEGPAHTVA